MPTAPPPRAFACQVARDAAARHAAADGGGLLDLAPGGALDTRRRALEVALALCDDDACRGRVVGSHFERMRDALGRVKAHMARTTDHLHRLQDAACGDPRLLLDRRPGRARAPSRSRSRSPVSRSPARRSRSPRAPASRSPARRSPRAGALTPRPPRTGAPRGPRRPARR